MTRQRRSAHRPDDNQAEIVAALRAIGCSVAITSGVGNGFPDLVVAKPGYGNLLLEIKDGTKVPSKRKLTDDEAKFHATWQGPIAIADSVEAALRAVKVLILARTGEPT